MGKKNDEFIYRGVQNTSLVSTSVQSSSSEQDFLYIGDSSDNTVKTFDAATGKFLGVFVTSNSGGLKGPRGLLFDHDGNLLVSNQNVDTGRNGSVLKYSGQTGAFFGNLVPSNSKEKNVPFAPRGTVLSDNNVLFVADAVGRGDRPGKLRAYDGTTGEFLGNLDHSGFNGSFHPRAVVIGPDGNLYVSVFDISNPLNGWVVRFNPDTGEFLGTFIESDSTNNLHRPEGLVFGPDGNLYVTSFRKDATDTDKILIFDNAGNFSKQLDLYNAGEKRAFAQAILFGPNGKLFVPITGPFDKKGNAAGDFTGSVRCYDVESGLFTVLVPPALAGGPLGVPWYLTFGKTNPATLAYK